MTIQNEKGFTLLEIILAVSILSIGILAVASMQAAALRGDAFAQNRTEGATRGQDKMEELLAMPFDDLDGASGTSTQNGYSITVVVDPGTSAETRKITITVLNQQGRQVSRLICLRSDLL